MRFHSPQNKQIVHILKVAFVILLGLFSLACSEGVSPQKSKFDFPNILLISLDACRADHLSCYGYQRKTSPFIDKIANDGIRFANAFVNTHGTNPSHTTMLTSLYQESHKVYYNGFDAQAPIIPIPTRAVMLQEILKVNGYITLGITGGGQLSRVYGFDRGFVEFDDQSGDVAAGCLKLVDLVSKYSQAQHPIFVFFHTYQTHSPYFPPDNYKYLFGKYDSQFIPSSENLLKHWESANRDLTKDDFNSLKALYDANIRYTDDVLRTTFEALEKTGFFKNFLLIITADHGEEFGEHGGLLHRKLLYDELLHVPFIMAGTRIPKNKTQEKSVSSIDIVPTILDYAGIKAHTPLMGKSLIASRGTFKDEIFSQYGSLRYSIRTAKWKFIFTAPSGNPELYDLQNDPQEQNNIAADEPTLSASFRDKIDRWKRSLFSFDDLTGETKSNKMDDKLIEKLKSLGYVQPKK